MADAMPLTSDNFIRMIENNRVLYDKGHPDHNNEDLKEAIWNAISVNFDTNVNNCKRLWEGISVPYFAALRIIDETGYVTRDRVLKRCVLKFLDEHQKDFVQQPYNEDLIKQIVVEVRRDMKKERKPQRYGLSAHMLTSIRQMKLNKWCDTTATRQSDPNKVKQIRKAVNGVVVNIMKSMKPDFIRLALKEQALLRSQQNNPTN